MTIKYPGHVNTQHHLRNYDIHALCIIIIIMTIPAGRITDISLGTFNLRFLEVVVVVVVVSFLPAKVEISSIRSTLFASELMPAEVSSNFF